jgi:hypothetical protein
MISVLVSFAMGHKYGCANLCKDVFLVFNGDFSNESHKSKEFQSAREHLKAVTRFLQIPRAPQESRASPQTSPDGCRGALPLALW